MLYLVTVDVPAAPQLGETSFDIEATSASEAERRAVRRVEVVWACSHPFRAVARSWDEIKADLARDRADEA